LLLYIIAFLFVLLIGWVVKKAVHLTPLGWVDHIFGGAIGLLKALIIFWVVCLSVSSFPKSADRFHAARSHVYKTYKKLPDALKLVYLTGVRDALKKNVDKDVPRKVLQAKKAIEDLKDKVDSVKSSQPKYR